MKRSNVILNLMFLAGLGLVLAAFLIFVPEERRTDVAWLNLAVAELIYVGAFGRFTILFRPLRSFADSAPLISAYWKYFGTCTFLAICCMIWGSRAGVAFEKQLFIQIALLFLFLFGLAVGYWVSERHALATVEERQTMNMIRVLQHAAADFQTMLEREPESFRGCKKLCEELVDDLNSMPGSNAPGAREAEERLFRGLRELNALDLGQTSPEELAGKLHTLVLAATQRKMMR